MSDPFDNDFETIGCISENQYSNGCTDGTGQH